MNWENSGVVRGNLLTEKEFNEAHWNAIGAADSLYDIVDHKSELPERFTTADRKMYYCGDESCFYFWDGRKWEKVLDDPTILTYEEFSALTPEEQESGNYIVQDYPFADPGAIANALDVTRNVGGVQVGDHYDAETPIETILRDILNPTDYPILTDPSVTLVSSVATLLEDGSSVSAVLTANFNRGRINPAYGTSGYRSGEAQGYSLNSGTEQAGAAFNVTVDNSHKTYSVVVRYAAGEQPKDSIGEDYSTPLPAGFITSPTLKYEFVNALWSNSASINTIAKHSLISKSAGTYEFNFAPQTVTYPEVFDVPADWTVSKIEMYNTISGKYDSVKDEFTKTTVTHNNAAGTAVSYNRYTDNRGYAASSRKIKITFS